MSNNESLIFEIQRKIEDFREIGIQEYFPRDISVLGAPQAVSVLTGARRSGKSFRTFQEINELLISKWLPDIQSICPIDFDNPHFSKMQDTDSMLIRDTFFKITPHLGLSSSILFIFDEIHRMQGWEDFVVDLSRNPNWKVIVTGSSSKMLSTEIATSLRGKSLTTSIYPLSFKEFLVFKKIIPTLSTKNKAQIQIAFQEYLQWGGFPQVTLSPKPVKEALLREYFDTMILKDIIQRHNVSRPQLCISTFQYLLSLMGKAFTQNSIQKYLRQAGHSLSNTHISGYLNWAEDAWFLFSVPIYSDSPAELVRNYKKCYCIDWALATQNSQSWDGALSRAFENLVYIHLARSYPRVNYYLTQKNRREVDFICVNAAGQPVLAVQACLKIGDGRVLEREVPPLVAAAKYFGIRQALVITLEEQRTFVQDGVTIQLIPAWSWMLEEPGKDKLMMEI